MAPPLGIMNMPPEQIEAIVNRGRTRGVVLPKLEDAAAGHAWLCGPPELIVEHLKQVERDYPGLERVNLGSAMGMPREMFKEQLSMFAEEVMPAFSGS